MARALILSGGGAKGAFTIGALNVLQEQRGQLDFDIISGTSTGSLIAALLAANRLDLLRTIYLSVDNSDIVSPQNIVANLIDEKPYLISDTPLRTMIDREITSEIATSILSSDITLLLTAVSLQTGKITVFTNKERMPPIGSKYNFRQLTSRAELLHALSASTNQFAFLPPIPVNVGGGRAEQMIDGGVRDTIPTRPVFEIEPEPDEVVVISNNPLSLFEVNKNYTSPIDILMRGISIFIQDVRENDLQVLNEWKAQTGKDYILIQPDADLDEAFPTGLRFEPQRMADMMVKGELKAREILGQQPIVTRTLRTLPRRGVVAIPRTTVLTGHSQCKGKTKDGKRCKNRVAGRAGYCHLHVRA